MKISNKKLFLISAGLLFVSGIILAIFEYTMVLPILPKTGWQRSRDLALLYSAPTGMFSLASHLLTARTPEEEEKDRKELLRKPSKAFVAALVLPFVLFIAIFAFLYKFPDGVDQMAQTVNDLMNKPLPR